MNNGIIIILNGPSCSGKTSIQKEFQKLCMPNLWIRTGIDTLFDGVMPEITPENMHFWQSENPIRWVESTQDEYTNNIVTLLLGQQGQKVGYAMNSCIAAYAQNGCSVIVDYIAYQQEWLADIERKLSGIKTVYVAITLPLAELEKREKNRGTSPIGHARSHYHHVLGKKKYDLTFDSSQQTAQEIAAQIKQHIEERY